MPIGSVAPTSVSTFDATAYLDRIRNTTPVQPVTPVASSDSNDNDNTTSSANTASTTGTGQVELSSNVLSILQSADSSTSNGRLLNNLFNSSRSNTDDTFSGLFNAVEFSISSTRPITQALETARAQQRTDETNNNQVQNLIRSYQDAQNATNETVRQNVEDSVRRILGGQDSIIA